MAEQQNMPKKHYNPLFNVSVTGATIDEFTQNAILCRAATPPPVLEQVPLNEPPNGSPLLYVPEETPTAEQLFNPPLFTADQDLSNSPSGYFVPVSNNQFPPHSRYQQPPKNKQRVPLNWQTLPHDQQSNSTAPRTFNTNNQPDSPHFPQSAVTSHNNNPSVPSDNSGASAVFSSFSNSFGDQTQQSNRVVRPPPGFTESDRNVNLIPLLSGPPFNSNTAYPATAPGPAPLPPATKGNSYRRQTKKRLTYAPIPGFSSAPPLVPPLPLVQRVPSPYEPPRTYINPHPKQPVSDDGKTIQFLPVLVAPGFEDTPVSHNPAPISTSSFLIPDTAALNEIPSLDCTSGPFLTPIMTSKPQIEVLSPTDPAVLPFNTVPQTTKTAQPMADIPQPEAAKMVSKAPYRPVYNHWFHRKNIEGRVIWQPFSMVDSLALEASYFSNDISPDHMVSTEGGRFDVNILRRQRTPVYWTGTPTEVRRCSWFHKGTSDVRFTPFEETIAAKLEEEYKSSYETDQWHKKIELPSGETVMYHAADVMVIISQMITPEFLNAPQSTIRPRVVKRGMDEFDIDEGEPSKIDHLLFLVHGIGSVCDLKFRSVEEVVDDFRSISLQLLQSHYKTSCELGIANRIEVLPVSWHDQLHSDDTGIDKKLKSITLESIPKMRDFTNDTLLDILFYTSPVYSQTIISTVGNEMNRLFDMFKQRNPGFRGSVSLGGHSLGSLILFDILCHQHPDDKEKEKSANEEEDDVLLPMKPVEKQHRRLSRRISYMMGKVGGTGQPQITYPHLSFHPIAFFALGSPIGMFVTVRGLENLGEQFALPTCQGFFNIFHPYDPVAYRIESLINPELSNARPVQIPHHKGRKRMHLELKDTMTRVGADLKARVMDSVKSTWNSFYQLTMFNRNDNTKILEAEVDKVLQAQITREQRERVRCDSTSDDDSSETDLPVGILNNGRRVDYVLQEAPFEFINEYLFALSSHVCYWESEDTMLLILKEIYSSMGISTDSQIPQQTMTIERSTPSPVPGQPHSMQMANPLRPSIYQADDGPSTSAGFVRQT